MRVGITGANGRMGQEVREVVRNRSGNELAFATTRSSTGSDGRSESLDSEAQFEELLDERDTDVVVDFTGPEATLRYVDACGEAGIPFVTGTTGLGADEQEVLREIGTVVPVLHGANFSRGVQALESVVESAVRTLPEYDVEVTETHHNGKQDAPSGTANVLLDQIEEVHASVNGGSDGIENGNDRIEDSSGPDERVHGRNGNQPRQNGEIGVHARRAGDVTGEHEVLLAGNNEILSLTHRAGDRGVFAAGALDAAVWVVNQPPGYYQFNEVASYV